jgi:hypothetical protein
MKILKEIIKKRILELESNLTDAYKEAQNFDASVFKHISAAEIDAAVHTPIIIARAKLDEAKWVEKQIQQRQVDECMAVT